MQKFFDNYEPFYNMILSTAIMSNAGTKAYRKDAAAIIDFIGKAYKLDETFIEEATSLILDKLSVLSLITDRQAVYGSRSFGEDFSDLDAMFDLKADVLSQIQELGKPQNEEMNSAWFDLSHYQTYQPNAAFAKINITSASGNVTATRQAGILKMLGIGCKRNPTEAIHRLTQCTFWGDIPSVWLLAYCYALNGDAKNSKIFYELADLCSLFLNAGYTVLPEDVKARYSAEACRYYVFVSSIKQDIVYAYKKFSIDFSFVEAITAEALQDFEIMGYINDYERKDWKNVSNPAEKPVKKLGFK